MTDIPRPAPDPDAPIVTEQPAAERLRISAPEPAKRRAWVPAAYALAVLVLAGAGLYLWRTPDPGTLGRPTNAEDATFPDRLAALEQRVDQLENRPTTPAAPQLAAVTARIDALERRPTITPAAPVQAPPDTDLAAKLAASEQRIDALSAQLAAIGQRSQGADAEIDAKLQALSAKVAGNDQMAGQISGLADRANRLARVQAAEAALDAGHPLGALPDAAPALARFADAAPPTEAALRLAFPDAASAALIAAQPQAVGQPFLQRAWARMQQSITLREGDRVIVGNPVAGILAHAQSALDAGDLAGAVAALGNLPPDAAQPLAAWLDQARALLAARAALADFAAHG